MTFQNNNGPSKKQEKVLVAIWRHIRANRRPPSYREIEQAIGAKSTSVVSHHVRRLEDMGLIRRDEQVARGLSLTEEALNLLGRISDAMDEAIHIIQLPIKGVIQAGLPIQIFSDTDGHAWEDTISVEAGLFPKNGRDTYALRVQGNSMIDALVNEGDIVVLQQDGHINEGDMVAAWLVEEEETTLKRIYRQGKHVLLQPANPDYPTMRYHGRDVEVQGKVILVQRRI